METVIQTVRRFSKRSGEIGAADTLGELGVASSLGLSLLRAALGRRPGAKVPLLGPATTVAELQAVVGEIPGEVVATTVSKAKSPAPVVATKDASAGGGLWGARGPAGAAPAWVGHGVDLEELADFPVWPAADADKRAFFATHFTAAELAAAEKHAEPSAHLCGVWCAKEALRKAVPAALRADWRELEITSGPEGAPVARGAALAGLGLALSISHSSRMAMASVVAWRV